MLMVCTLFATLLMADTSRALDAPRWISIARLRSPEALAGAHALKDVIQSSAGYTLADKLKAANDFFNRRISFQDDRLVWGVDDYWASPLELLDRGRGDCEDFAIAKYFTLLAMGVPASKLRLVYARALMDRSVQPHMVLAYYDDPSIDAPLILDNLVAEIRRAPGRSDLTPIFSFNSEGLWQGIGSHFEGDPIARLSYWRGALAKAHAEGF
jgi:predicted transglutaminase-like cysteine proteinase